LLILANNKCVREAENYEDNEFVRIFLQLSHINNLIHHQYLTRFSQHRRNKSELLISHGWSM